MRGSAALRVRRWKARGSRLTRHEHAKVYQKKKKLGPEWQMVRYFFTYFLEFGQLNLEFN